MKPGLDRDRFLPRCLWAASGLAAIGGVLAMALPAGGENRIAGMALPFGVAAAALAAHALTGQRTRWLAALLYAIAMLAVLYGLMVGASIPLRLAVEGRCEPAPAPCPVGFDRPLAVRESWALGAAVICGLLAEVVTFVAIEVQYRTGL
jgi:hypothetical protein